MGQFAPTVIIRGNLRHPRLISLLPVRIGMIHFVFVVERGLENKV